MVTYNVEFTVNDASDTNNVLTINLNDKASWTGLPASCLSTAEDGVVPDSELQDTNGDDKNDTIICNLGPLEEGTKLLLKPAATAIGANGDIIEASVCSDSDGNVNTGMDVTAQCSGPVNTEITAIFRVDVSKSVAGLSLEDEPDFVPPAFDVGATPFGVQGQMMIWQVDVDYAPGSELLANVGGLADIDLVDDATILHSELGDISATDTIEPFVIPSVVACNPLGTATYSIACAQPGGPGAPIEISLTGVPVNNAQLASFNILVWVPQSDINQDPAVEETINIINQVDITGLNGNSAPLTSVSGTPNPGTESATADFFLGEFPGLGNFVQRKGFDRLVVGKPYARTAAKGDVIETTISISGSCITRDGNIAVCDTINTSVFEFAGVDPVGVQLDADIHGRPATQIGPDLPYHGLYKTLS